MGKKKIKNFNENFINYKKTNNFFLALTKLKKN